MRLIIPLMFCYLFSIELTGQKFIHKKIKDIKIQNKVEKVSVDRLGGFYTVGECTIQQFNPDGKLTGTYKLDACESTEIIEAWQLMRIYAYQSFKQQFTIFNNHLEEVDKLNIDPAFVIEPKLSTPSPDLSHYWIVDADNSIKRVNIKNRAVDIESESLKSVEGRFIHIREYQNMLFLLNEYSGIYVLNMFGKLMFKIPGLKTSYFSFAGEDLYYLEDNRIHFFDIFTKETYSTEVSPGFKFVIATDEKLILIKDGKGEIYEFTPRK